MRYLLLSLLFLVGCAGTLNKKNERISRGIYATQDSLVAKRYDLASKYSSETVKLVEPPKKRIKVPTITFSRIDPETNLEIVDNLTILPEGNASDKGVRLNSKEYFELLKQKDIARAFTEGEEAWKKYSAEVELQKKEDAKEKDRLAAELEKERNKGIGIFDVLKYVAMALVAVPFVIILLILLWLGKIALKVIKS